jgi:signal transduction histidine kinase
MTPSKLEALEMIVRLCSRISTMADLPEMLRGTADTLARVLQADRVAIIEFDLKARRVGNFVGGGPGVGKVRTEIQFEELWEGLSGWVLRERKAALSSKERSDARESIIVQRRRLETEAGSIIVVPFLFQDQILGTMTAINTPEQRDFDEGDVETMELFAKVCAVVIENTRLLMRLRQSERELLDENDLKDRLFTVLAHDLRGPIGNLHSMLTMLAERIDEPELVRDLVPLGLQSAERTFALTENLLTWIRGQLKGVPLATRRVTAAELVKPVIENLGHQAAGKGITIRLDSPAAVTLDTEPNTVQAIVRNLISNAVKFSPSGQEVVVSAERDGPEVVFEVRDSGVGMTPEQVAGLFRGRPVNPYLGTSGEKGNGLGLMFSSDLAKTVHGWLEASSELGKGSSIRLIVSDAEPDEL